MPEAWSSVRTGNKEVAVDVRVVGVLAGCWRSRKARVPKEVLFGARSHREDPLRDSWAVSEIVFAEPLPGAGAPTDPQSRRRVSVVLDHTGGAHPAVPGQRRRDGRRL